MLTVKQQTDIDPYIDISRENVCRRIGYSANADPSPRIASLVDEYIKNAKQLIEPSYAYTIMDVKEVGGVNISIEESLVFRSRVISQVLEQCPKVAIFILTIGDRLEEMAAHLADEGLIVESYVLDAIGSGIAEKMADFVQGIIGEIAHLKGFCISRRFSPGYCDWDISQQEVIFKVMNEHFSDVQLSNGYLMTPQKSISGIIGIGPQGSNVETYNPCKSCKRHNCIGRR